MSFKVALTSGFIEDLNKNKDLYIFARRYGHYSGSLEALEATTYEEDTKTTLAYMPTEFNLDTKIATICVKDDNLDNYDTLYLMYNTVSHEIPGDDSDGNWNLAAVIKVSFDQMPSYTTSYITIDLSDYQFSCNILITRSVTSELYQGQTSSVFVSEHEHITTEDNEDSDVSYLPGFLKQARDIRDDSINDVDILATDSLLVSDSGAIYQIQGGVPVEVNPIPNDLQTIVTNQDFIDNQLKFNLEELYTMGDFKIRLLGEALPEMENPTLGTLNAIVTNAPGNPAARDLYYINLPSKFHYYGMTPESTTFNDLTDAGTYKLDGTTLTEGPSTENTYTGILTVSSNYIDNVTLNADKVILQKLVLGSGATYTRVYNGISWGLWHINIDDSNVREFGYYTRVIENDTDLANAINAWSVASTTLESVAIIGKPDGSPYVLTNPLNVPYRVTCIDGFNNPVITLAASGGISYISNSGTQCGLSNIAFNVLSPILNFVGIKGFTNVINCKLNLNNVTASISSGLQGCKNLINCNVQYQTSSTITAKCFDTCQYLSNCDTNIAKNLNPYVGSTYVDVFTCKNYITNETINDISTFSKANFTENRLENITVTELNRLTKPGNYKVTDNNNFTLSQFGASSQYFNLQMMVCGSTNAVQIATSASGNRSVIRVSNDITAETISWTGWMQLVTTTLVNDVYQLIVSKSKKLVSSVSISSFDNDMSTLKAQVQDVGDTVSVVVPSNATGIPNWVSAGPSAGIFRNIGENEYHLILYRGNEFALRSCGNTWGEWCYPIMSSNRRPRTVTSITEISTNSGLKFKSIPMCGLNSDTTPRKGVLLQLDAVTAVNTSVKVQANTSVFAQGVGVISIKVAATLINDNGAIKWASESGGALVSLALQATNDPKVSAVYLGLKGTIPSIFIGFSDSVANPAIMTDMTYIYGNTDVVNNTEVTILFSTSNTGIDGFTSSQTININAGSVSYNVTNQIGGVAITELIDLQNKKSKKSATVDSTNAASNTTYKLLGVLSGSSGPITPVILNGISVVNGEILPDTVNTQGS